MSLFKYEIAAPTNVVEASASPEPDDVSVVYIRIEATPTREITKNEISEIWFEINVLSASDEKNDEKKREALTRNPGNITPVAKDFGRWTFSVPGNKNKFIARPDVPTKMDTGILVKQGETLVFYLYDVEVIDREGLSQVKVTEVYPTADPEKLEDLETMRIRKIHPNLRIDYFRANKYATTVPETTDAEVNAITLSWATTSAEIVELWGPDGSDILVNQKEFSHVTSNGKPIDTGFKDAEIKLTNPPQSTSTYTLIAKGNADDINKAPVALQQLTITVTDQVKTNRLTGDQLEIQSDNGVVTISSSLQATGNLRINGRTTLDGDIILNKDKVAGNRARVRATGDIVSGQTGRTSDAKLHFDLLDSSDASGWTEDVLVLHGNGHIGVGSSEVDASNKLIVNGTMKVSERLTLDGNIILNNDASNRARVRATGDIVSGQTGRTSDAKLHFDLLDSSDASGWTEDVLVLHGDGHVGVGSSEVDASNKLTVNGNTKVDGQATIRDGLVPYLDSGWRAFDLTYRQYNVLEYQETVGGINLNDFILDIKVMYEDKTQDPLRIYDVTNQIQISYCQAPTPPNTVTVSLFWRDLNLSSLGGNLYVNHIYKGSLRVLVWKVPCNAANSGNNISFHLYKKEDRVQ